MTLADRSVLITGATSGVGRALAVAWAERGAHVLVHGRDARRLREVSEVVGGTPLSVDLAEPDGPSRLANAAQEATPPVSALVNNAAIQLNYLFTEEASAEAAEAIDREVTVDLTAPLQTTALLLPTLREAANLSGSPSLIINVTSGLALAPKKTAAVYCAAKAGLRAFSKALRYQMKDAVQEGAPTVRVVEVMLPLVDTPMTAGRDTRVGKMDPESVAEEILSGLWRERARSCTWAKRAPSVSSIAGRLGGPSACSGMGSHAGSPCYGLYGMIRLHSTRRCRCYNNALQLTMGRCQIPALASLVLLL